MAQVKVKQGTKNSVNNNAGILNAGTLAVTTDTDELFVTHNDGTLHQLCVPIVNTYSPNDQTKAYSAKYSDEHYIPLSGGAMTGDLDMAGNNLVNAGFETFATLPTTFKGTQITFGGKVYTWNVAEGKYKCDSDYLEIGGRNLLANTQNLIDTPYRTDDKYLGFNILRCTKIVNEYVDLYRKYTINIVSELEYIVSFYAKASVNSGISCFFYAPNTTTSSENSQGGKTTSIDGYSYLSITTEWQKYWVKWKQSETTTTKNVIIGRNASMPDGSILEICGIKLEKGNKATDWTPAPEDKADNEQYINYDLSAEPNETGTKIKTANTLWQNLFNHTNFLWAKVKDLFSVIPLSVNDGYIPKIDDVNKKLIKSNINDNGSRVQIDSPLRVNSNTFYNVAEKKGVYDGLFSGCIIIDLPIGAGYNVGMYEIEIYDDNNNRGAKLYLRGQNYIDDKWYNTSASIIGSLTSNRIRLAYNNNVGKKCFCFIIGETTTTWSYPQIYVSKVIRGFNNAGDWSTGWNINIVNTESGLINITEPTVNAGMMLDGKTLTQQISDNDLRYLGLTAKAADSEKLDGYDSTHFGYYSNETLGNNVDFDTIHYQLDELLHTQPIHVPNYSSQLNTPFNKYGQLLTFGGQEGLFPVQFAISDAGGATEFLYRCQYQTTTPFSFTKLWTKLWTEANFDPGSKADLLHNHAGTYETPANVDTKIANALSSLLTYKGSKATFADVTHDHALARNISGEYGGFVTYNEWAEFSRTPDHCQIRLTESFNISELTLESDITFTNGELDMDTDMYRDSGIIRLNPNRTYEISANVTTISSSDGNVRIILYNYTSNIILKQTILRCFSGDWSSQSISTLVKLTSAYMDIGIKIIKDSAWGSIEIQPDDYTWFYVHEIK